MPPSPFHVMVKPTGSLCNLDCKYCFYLEKERLYDQGPAKRRLEGEQLESFIRQYIETQVAAQEGTDATEIGFAWQGGEPTLLGVEYFEKVVELERRHCPPGKTVSNAFQTNGVLIDERWCAFLKANDFLIGLSVDGPARLHDAMRVDKGGRPTHHHIMRTVELFRRHGVRFNTLTCVGAHNQEHGLEVYRWLRDELHRGEGFCQFIPLVERNPFAPSDDPHLLAGPPQIESEAGPVTKWSVGSRAYGDFLCAVYDEWVRHDVGRMYVQLFDVMLGIWAGLPASLCVFAERCGNALALEHDGTLYACDHYVYPEFSRGKVGEKTLREMVDSPEQRRFGNDKQDLLPGMCRRCEWKQACQGECPKHRILRTPEGEPGLNWLCAGYKRFFAHIDPGMKAMAQLLAREQPPALIMQMMRNQDRGEPANAAPGRNDPCPCGSGKKYKHCHGR